MQHHFPKVIKTKYGKIPYFKNKIKKKKNNKQINKKKNNNNNNNQTKGRKSLPP